MTLDNHLDGGRHRLGHADQPIPQTFRAQCPQIGMLAEEAQRLRRPRRGERDAAPLEGEPEVVYAEPGDTEAQGDIPRRGALADAGGAADQKGSPRWLLMCHLLSTIRDAAELGRVSPSDPQPIHSRYMRKSRQVTLLGRYSSP